MATAEERVLALAVARGLIEPQEAGTGRLAGLVADGRLSEKDRRRLQQDLADMDAAEAEQWSMEITAEGPSGSGQGPNPAGWGLAWQCARG